MANTVHEFIIMLVNKAIFGEGWSHFRASRGNIKGGFHETISDTVER